MRSHKRELTQQPGDTLKEASKQEQTPKSTVGRASAAGQNEEKPPSQNRLQFGQTESAYNRLPGVNDNVDLLPSAQSTLPVNENDQAKMQAAGEAVDPEVDYSRTFSYLSKLGLQHLFDEVKARARTLRAIASDAQSIIDKEEEATV